MTQLMTHFTQHADEATAKAQLAKYLDSDGSWRRDIVDPGVPVQEPAGSGTLKVGFFTNINLPALDTSIPGLTGAGYRDPVTKQWVKLWGALPADAPQQEFAT